ncbi:Cyclin-dependent kinase regulatory subunit family protein [Theileria parva strain Muguga]|uniref:Cyclin-dependent kinases regulatory subunit n=1 Tax=Theileria parva TaxID=5875 RepID=Q4N0M7_THEPA|nr:Cyclin-dependent kinase regulatory subunit family protein [Theileria parva strain Muguga]EAN30825.1 Cyclin-dependent kinase regulatory subunit family protein [Theileria parva strain Muguga]|eukprot:XP_763108.1 hypothetical protein [Theileria parva strain Muguga]
MLKRIRGGNTTITTAKSLDVTAVNQLNTEPLVRNRKRTRATQTHTHTNTHTSLNSLNSVNSTNTSNIVNSVNSLNSVNSVGSVRLGKSLKPIPNTKTTLNTLNTGKINTNTVNTGKINTNTLNTGKINTNTLNTVNTGVGKEGEVLSRINSIISKSRFKRLCREYVGDFWSRVDSNEIPILPLLHIANSCSTGGTVETVENTVEGTVGAVEASAENVEAGTSGPSAVTEIQNISIITMSVSDYSYKSTPFGDVYYSPRFQDDKYIYRYVILTKGVRNEAYRLLKQSKSYLLTEHQIIRELCIDLSPGWEHFMLFKNRLDELILRRKL